MRYSRLLKVSKFFKGVIIMRFFSDRRRIHKAGRRGEYLEEYKQKKDSNDPENRKRCQILKGKIEAIDEYLTICSERNCRPVNKTQNLNVSSVKNTQYGINNSKVDIKHSSTKTTRKKD